MSILIFRAYAAATPSGTTLGTFTQAFDKWVTVEHNALGGGGLTINRHESQAAWAAPGNYVRAWRDAVSGAAIAGFWIDSGGDAILNEDEEGGDEWKRGGAGPIACLKEALVWHRAYAGGDGHLQAGRGRWHWDDAHPGKVLNRLLNEAQARGCIPFVTWDFSGTLDSDSNAWSHEDARRFDIPIGLDMLSVVGEMRESDLVVEMDAEFVLHAWEHPHGTDHSAMVFEKGVDLREASERQVMAREGRSHALIEGTTEDGDTRYKATQNDTYETALGRRKELFVSYPRTGTTSMLKRVGGRRLRRSMKLHDGLQTMGVLDSTGQVALVDYFPGDTVTIDIPDVYDEVEDEPQAITLRDRPDGAGEYDVILDFGDLGYDPVTGADFSGGRSGTGDGPGDPDNPPDVTGDEPTGIADMTEYLFDGFDVPGPTSLGSEATAIAGTAISLALPDGSDVVGRLLLMNAAWDNRTNVDPIAAIVAEGWTEFLAGVPNDAAADYRSSWFWRIIDGTEGYPATGATLDFTLAASANVAAVIDLLEGWYDDGSGGPGWAVNPGTTADPDAIASTTWPTDTGVRWYTSLITDGSAITAGPTGYTSIGTATIGDIRIRGDAKNNTTQAEDPATYTASGVKLSYTVAIRGGGLGSLPVPAEGAWWPGGNPWFATASDFDDWGVAGGLFFFESSTPSAFWEATVAVVDGELPFEAETWEVLIRYRLTTASVPADPGARYLHLQWGDIAYINPLALVVDFGSPVGVPTGPPAGEGIVVVGTSGFDKQLGALGVGQWNLVRWQYDGVTLRARIWAEAAAEPTTWAVEVASEPPDDETTFYMTGTLGNNGGTAQLFELDYIKVSRFPTSGQRVEDHLVAVADGATDTFATLTPFIPGSLTTKVAGFATLTESRVPATGSFTFDDDPSAGSRILASWTVA